MDRQRRRSLQSYKAKRIYHSGADSITQWERVRVEVYDQYKSSVILEKLMKLLHNKQFTKPYGMRSIASDFT